LEVRSQKARCSHCRTEVAVPSTYVHGDHIRCGACGTQHKVRRGDTLRLVLADVTPLQESLRDTEHRIESLESELRDARASFGIGVNGLAIGVAYVVYQVGFKDAVLAVDLLWPAAGIAVGSGLALELCNWLFFTKHAAITRLSEEIATLRNDARQLQQKIREARFL